MVARNVLLFGLIAMAAGVFLLTLFMLMDNEEEMESLNTDKHNYTYQQRAQAMGQHQAHAHNEEEEGDGKQVVSLPISSTNPLYRKRTDATEGLRESFKKEVKEFVEESPDDMNRWETLLETYVDSLGANGLMDCMNEIRESGIRIPSQPTHYVGEYLWRKGGGVVKDVIEIVGNSMLSKAPLHGAVWSALVEVQVSTTAELFSYINELCWFEREPDMHNVWISCIHGIGHGLAKKFGMERYGEAVSICGMGHNADFVYACATGVNMELSNRYPQESWSPCDTNSFPAACYRFKGKSFEKAREKVEFPCANAGDAYHMIGCVWGESYTFKDKKNPFTALERCGKYEVGPDEEDTFLIDQYLTCLDAYWTDKHLNKEKRRDMESFCSSIPLRDAKELCLHYGNEDRGSDNKWNYVLLEKYRHSFHATDGKHQEWL